MTSEQRNGAFTILVVCTGNVCRSPLAERLLSARLNSAGLNGAGSDNAGSDSARLNGAGSDSARSNDPRSNSATPNGPHVVVHSAGTRALVFEDMTPETSALVDRYAGRPGPHRAQQLTEPLIAEADLVLTATRAHRSEVVSLLPRASRYTYTLTQFARLVEAAHAEGPQRSDDATASLRTLVDDAAAMRGFVRPATAEDDDIEDPYRRSAEVYDRVGMTVDRAVEQIARAMSDAGRSV